MFGPANFWLWHDFGVPKVSGSVRYRRESGPDADIAGLLPLTQSGHASLATIRLPRQHG